MEKLKERLLAKVNPKTNRTMTETTANQYIRYLNNLGGLVGIKDKEKTLQKINDKYSASTQASIYNALSVCCDVSRGYKTLGKFYKSKFRDAITPINEQRNQTEKTEKEKEYWLNWDDIIKRRNELEGLDRIILSLYTWLPPRRAKDFGTMEINSKTGNSFEPRTQRFIFRDYKTAGTYGEQVIDVPDDLYIELMDYLKGRESGKLLPISTVSITKHLNSIFKPKKISVSALRHIYDTHHFGETKKRMNDTARLMAHSSAQQQQYIKG
jgi:integrase